MKINHNMSAVITNAQLLRTENSLTASMERLSSGLKINHAKDDPAGMAIGNKMQAQIDGLNQASQNASNGTSVLQIADSALGEITDMLQRMRELSVQAATDTNTQSDRTAIQQEIDSLKAEVDRISTDTEYNTKKLLDGTSDTRVYADSITRMSISDAVSAGDYKLTINAAATQATSVATTQAGTIPEGKVVINDMEISIAAGEDAASVFEKLRDGAEKADVNLMVIDAGATQDLAAYPATGGYTSSGNAFAFGDRLAFVSNRFGEEAEITFSCNNDALAAFLGLDATTDTAGTSMDITADLTTSFGSQATVTAEGNRVKVTDVAGFKMDFMVDAGTTGELDIEVTDIGTMTLQIGANEHQTMQVRIPEVSGKTLYLDEVDVTKVKGGDKAIVTLDAAIETSTSVRAKIGAYQNRLDYAIESLDGSSEDMTNAISRIQDVDMAKEMSEYTKYNVLDQAAVSVLAQANDIPQTVLQLLQ